MTAVHAHKEALQFYVDNGVDIVVGDAPRDYYAPAVTLAITPAQPAPAAMSKPVMTAPSQSTSQAPAILGASEARTEAAKIAKTANTLDELRDAIASFDGIGLKKTASNMVFADGNPQAKIMVIGDVPETAGDRTGKPFAGEVGQLLDKMLDCIDISRTSEALEQSVYLSNLINWRPPGNRSLNTGEIEASLPFIERHIQLVQPKLIILCGGVAAKAILGKSESISRLRKKWHDYTPQTLELQEEGASPIPALVTFHPSYLLGTPTQKRAAWADLIAVQKKRLLLDK